MIETLEDILDQLCNEISSLLTFSTVIEASTFKPGNASRFQDLKNVKYLDLIFSAILAQDSYKVACTRGFRGQKTIFDLLYITITTSKKLNVNYSILGTQMLLLPISYAVTKSTDITSLKMYLTQVIKTLDKQDGEWFIKSLKELRPSYLGTLNVMDYRSIEGYTLYQILEFSAKIDSVARNMISGYRYSFEAYEIIKSCKDKVERCIQIAYLSILSEVPDGLVYRKFGGRVALTISKLASEILKHIDDSKIAEFNEYLVTNGFNPGSTADIIASGIALYLIDDWYERNRSNHKFPL